MKSCLRLALLVLLSAVVVLGCSKNTSPPTPIPADQLPAALEKAFSKAEPAAKEFAAQVLAGLQAKDYSKAFFAAQQLTGQPKMNKEQVNVAGGALLTINSLLLEAQAKGDSKADQTLKFYKANK